MAMALWVLCECNISLLYVRQKTQDSGVGSVEDITMRFAYLCLPLQ